MNGKELENTNVTRTYKNEAGKHKETLSTYVSEDEEKTSSTTEKKEKSRDGYVIMYECNNKLCH